MLLNVIAQKVVQVMTKKEQNKVKGGSADVIIVEDTTLV